jgi:hypothetical protein
MRAKEFIPEGQDRKPLRKGIQQSMPNLTSYDQLDNNNAPYLAYRFGIALAGSPGTEDDMYKRGPIGSNFNMIDYSDGDTEIRRGAEKKMGVKASRSTGKGSKEVDGLVNKVSPVSRPKKNRYGV